MKMNKFYVLCTLLSYSLSLIGCNQSSLNMLEDPIYTNNDDNNYESSADLIAPTAKRHKLNENLKNAPCPICIIGHRCLYRGGRGEIKLRCSECYTEWPDLKRLGIDGAVFANNDDTDVSEDAKSKAGWLTIKEVEDYVKSYE